MPEPWSHALESVRAGRATVLAVVVGHTGSVPGTTGATIVVSDSGCAGTVGGGVAEHEVVERARRFQGASELIDIEHTPEGSGSLCSGSHTLAMLGLGSGDLPTLESIVATLGRDAAGALHLSGEGLAFEPDRVAPTGLARDAHGWRFETTIGRLDTLHIFGGGHVALALSRVMATLPFRIVVLDDRPDLPTMAANPFAQEQRIIDYQESDRHVTEGDRSWAVIMTFGHRSDEVVLRRLIGRRLRYLGLLGSAAKVRQLFARLRDDGVAPELLERVSAPIGLAIGSHTPEEIAISIAAEIVMVRNRA